MLRPPAILALLVLATVPVSAANAAEWVVIRWIGPQRCEIVIRRPPFGRWEELAAYRSRKDAEAALDLQRRLKACKAPATDGPGAQRSGGPSGTRHPK